MKLSFAVEADWFGSTLLNAWPFVHLARADVAPFAAAEETTVQTAAVAARAGARAVDTHISGWVGPRGPTSVPVSCDSSEGEELTPSAPSGGDPSGVAAAETSFDVSEGKDRKALCHMLPFLLLATES